MHLPETMPRAFACAAFASALLACSNPPAVAAPVGSSKADANFVRQQGIALQGELVTALSVTDKAGEHLLVLTQSTGPSQSTPRSGRAERTDLYASYYLRASGKWAQQWTIRDFSDCPGLDHEAKFFPEDVSVTDLNKNGEAEVTVAYKLFCGGGIDESVLKVILREGEQKFAMRGTTIIQTPGNEPFGGEAVYDKSLEKPVNKAFKRHIAAVRDKVVVQKY